MEKRLGIFSHYDKKYLRYAQSWKQTYKGNGALGLTYYNKVVGRKKIINLKPHFYSECAKKQKFDYYVFSDIDLVFKTDFCFSEICKQGVSLIFRDGSENSEPIHSKEKFHLRVNASLIVVDYNSRNFLWDWLKASQSINSIQTVLDKYSNKKTSLFKGDYYWDQATLAWCYDFYKEKYQFNNIDYRIYLSKRLHKKARVMSCHHVDLLRKKQLLKYFLESVK